jgi:Shikimate 5-dehydrogenase
MRFGIVGNPVGHSLSPTLFRAAYPDGRDSYELVLCKAWSDAWRSFCDGFDAVNVTAPFKRDAFESAAKCDPASFRAQASNVLIRRGELTVACNTDFTGVRNILSRRDVRLRDAGVLVIGCGGAGRAAAIAAVDLECRSVAVADRTFETAEEFVMRLRDERAEAVALNDGKFAAAFERAGIVVYALPVALKEIIMLDFSGKALLEANYRDPALSGVGCGEYVSGREWLLEQAVEGFRLMTGREPDDEAMRKAIL